MKVVYLITTDTTDLGVYKNKMGYGPNMIDHEAALCLSSTIATKASRGQQWNLFVDNHQITPNVRVANSNVAKLYLVFHVSEYTSDRTLRNLFVEVSAAWQKEEVEKEAKEQADGRDEGEERSG